MGEEHIEDNIPTEEEQSRLRQERLTEIGKLPSQYGILVVILEPSKNIILQADGLAPFEIWGLARFVQIQYERAMLIESGGQRQHSDDPDQKIM